MSHIIMIDEPNGNNVLMTSLSTDDLSQSLSNSEYTDADESMSAPTEFLAEFLSSVMRKDYKNALKYCKLILQFEPNNVTAKEFYPLIEEKIKLLAEKSSSDSDENYNNISTSKFAIDNGNGEIVTDGSEHDDSESEYSTGSDSDEKELDMSNINTSNSTSGNENTTHSYSSSLLEGEEEEDGDEEDVDEDGDNCVSCRRGAGYCKCGKFTIDVGDDDDEDGNNNTNYNMGFGSSSYNNDEECNNDNIESLQKVIVNSHHNQYHHAPNLSDLNNGNYKSASCSDSESPTEPLTQRLAAILRSKISSSTSTKKNFVT